MIIRNRATKTLKASPLNSRGYERSEHPRIPSVLVISTLKESPNAVDGARLQRAFHCFSLSAGPTDAAAIEGRPRCGLAGGIFADNHKKML